MVIEVCFVQEHISIVRAVIPKEHSDIVEDSVPLVIDAVFLPLRSSNTRNHALGPRHSDIVVIKNPPSMFVQRTSSHLSDRDLIVTLAIKRKVKGDR